MCIFRIVLGLLVLVNALTYAPDFLVWFGARGVSPLEMIDKIQSAPLLSLMIWLKPPDMFYQFLFAVLVLASAFLTVGFKTRLSSIVVYAISVFFFERNPLMWHQVDGFLRPWCLLIIFAPCAEMYSLDCWIKNKAWQPKCEKLYAPFAQRLIQFQMCMVYVEAFFGKMAGDSWRNGEAVYFATHFPDGMRNLVPPLFDHLFIYKFLTYYTLGIEFALWTLIWWRPLRYWVILGGVIFHLGIHYFIHLDLLEFGIMICYICFIDAADLERFMNRFLQPRHQAVESRSIS